MEASARYVKIKKKAVSQCQPTVPSCNCTFSEESVFDTRSEIMAASVGAMSPLLLTGIGFAIWKYIQSKAQDIPFERAPSDISDDYYEQKRGSKGRVSPLGSDYNYARRGSTPLSISDTDNEYYISETPTSETPLSDMNQDEKWRVPTKAQPPSNNGRVVVAPAKSDSLNGWMF
ncbi:uncharacterized protein LOC133182492 [Saccostrea echinata]|uniref:uncharacterized protein LOC133182492 n=1 Tax=Saccostrea echinata TaxID=191078 RepID=UPI002A806FEB|nr:uncharacterized protein LOC133182492 [Saccostrea echinata]